MAIYQINEEEWRLIDEALIRTQTLESIVPQIITEVPMAKSIIQTFNTVVPPLADNSTMWSVANIAIKEGANVGFKTSNIQVWRWQLTGHLPVFELETSRNNGEALDTIIFEQLSLIGTKEKEKFVLSGEKPKGGRAVSASLTNGLTGLAGNTSVAGAAASLKTAGNFTLTVADMKEMIRADGHDGSPLMLITNSRSRKYLDALISVNAGLFELDIVERLLNGGKVLYSDGIMNPTAADDVTLLMVENKPTNYRLKTYPQKVITGAYDPISDSIPFRIESYHSLMVYQPNAICKNVTQSIT